MEPDRLQKRFRRKRSANLTDSESDFLGTDQVFSSSNIRSKRQIPHIIYPEILAIVDYDGYRLHGGDNVQVKRYFVSFWNGVDLRYRLLKGPRIRISIAGIIISRVSRIRLNYNYKSGWNYSTGSLTRKRMDWTCDYTPPLQI